MKNLVTELKFSKEINFLFLSILLFAIAVGSLLVILPAILLEKGFAPYQVNIYFAFEMAGGIAMSFYLTKIVARLNSFQTIKIASISYAAITSIMYFCSNFYLWFLISFAIGMLWFMFVITRQSWLNMLIHNEQRGIATAIFTMAIAVGIFIGPIIVKINGATSYLSFLIVSLLTVISFICLQPLKKIEIPEISSQKIKIKKFFNDNPELFLSRFFTDFQVFLTLTCTVTFGIKIGLSAETAGLLISSFMFSCVIDIFIGDAFKKYSAQRIINFGFLGSFFCFLAIYLLYQYYAILLVIYFILGIFCGCMFIGNLKLLNDSYDKQDLLAANSTFQLIASLGSMAAAILGAFLINIFGILAFPPTLLFSPVIYLIFITFHARKHATKN